LWSPPLFQCFNSYNHFLICLDKKMAWCLKVTTFEITATKRG
jgi:hypothetical protein